MKKLILAALAASVVTAPAMAAPHQDRDHGRVEQRHDDRRFDKHPDYRQQVQYRSWKRGDRFDARYTRNYRVISSPRAYHLREAPRGYRWVQSGNDAVLVGVATGLIASIIAGAVH